MFESIESVENTTLNTVMRPRRIIRANPFYGLPGSFKLGRSTLLASIGLGQSKTWS